MLVLATPASYARLAHIGKDIERVASHCGVHAKVPYPLYSPPSDIPPATGGRLGALTDTFLPFALEHNSIGGAGDI
jgi:hypothetical protein